MTFDIDKIRSVYAQLSARIDAVRLLLGHPLTLTEKILYAHLWAGAVGQPFVRGTDYVDFAPDCW